MSRLKRIEKLEKEVADLKKEEQMTDSERIEALEEKVRELEHRLTIVQCQRAIQIPSVRTWPDLAPRIWWNQEPPRRTGTWITTAAEVE